MLYILATFIITNLYNMCNKILTTKNFLFYSIQSGLEKNLFLPELLLELVVDN